KWTTLSHNGPLFVDPYRALPKEVAFYYEDLPLKLNPTAEELATLYAKFMNSPLAITDTFNENFFKDFQSHLSRALRRQILSFELCDFTRISCYIQGQQEVQRKLMTPMMRNQYGFCTIDGKRHRVPHFSFAGPILYSRSGPKYGMVKPRIQPEDVNINSQENGAPGAPDGHTWKSVIHDRRVDWLWSWTDALSGRVHYVRARKIGNIVTCRRKDMDTARRLQTRLSHIRRVSRQDWNSECCFERQRAVALYFIDRLGFQVFSESEDNPKIVSVCDLRVKDLVKTEYGTAARNTFKLRNDNFKKSFKVHPEILRNLHDFLDYKDADFHVFEELSSNVLFEYLESLMDGLTPKMFWIYNACTFLQKNLQKFPPNKPLKDHLKHYQQVLNKIYNYFNQKDGKSLSYLHSSLHMSSSAQRIRDIQRSHNSLDNSATSSTHSIPSRRLPPISHSNSNVSTNRRFNIFRTDRQKNILKYTMRFLDPRITIAWCHNRNIPIKEIYTTHSLRQAVHWARFTNKHFTF
ncbi:hypothetical protein KR067_001324, partial [Drosophila pandora]